MSVIELLNGGFMYLVCGGIILFVAIMCVVFMVRAWKAGKAIGMETSKLRQAVTSSAAFSILPSVGILLGVIALSGSMGIPWPWLRLSVIGALHYETTVAQGAAEQLGVSPLSAQTMTTEAFATIALLMCICIMWGMILASIFSKSYLRKLKGGRKQVSAETEKKGGFGDMAMTAMFIGMCSAYIGSYLGDFISGNGLFTFSGSLIPIITAIVAALAMALLSWLSKKKALQWLESFSLAGSMLIGMAAAVLAGSIIG
jgi:hypothetical protein